MKPAKKSILTVLVLSGLFLLGMASCTFLELAMQGDSPESEDITTQEVPESVEMTAAELSSDFADMVVRVQRMRRSQLTSRSDRDILELGNPLRVAAISSVVYGDSTLQALDAPITRIVQNHATISARDHNRLSREIEQIVGNYEDESHQVRNLSAETVRQILLNINQREAGESCADVFNVQNGHVLLSTGDHFNIANELCPEGSVFIVLPGTHTGQKVESSKEGNRWIGIGRALMDGENELARAFNGGLRGNIISHLDIRNYTDHGVYASGSRNVLIQNNRFHNIAREKHGQEHGAIMFQYSENLEIKQNHFENVASSIRLRNSNGPLIVSENTALNSGRNFFQCDKCNGSQIRINLNSMEQTEQFGNVPLEDWINLYESNGERGNSIQVNYNRAKGHGDSNSGSFIMLGDNGGSYQEAVGNIGVNPGQVGIGIAGGVQVKVEGNKMYSERWESSNVAFYSAAYSTPCEGHQFTDGTNLANWRNSQGQLNRSWSDGRCGISNTRIRGNVRDDSTIGPGIWNEW
ncbi:MAG: right-handed parallel beta-helix repeat-containing protein [Balneolaceae bacterium]|nr:right-handed parallel beta-helix repeat-containing protein [Balneolaceae bacterium]